MVLSGLSWELTCDRLLSFPGVGFRYINLYQNLKEAHMP